MKAQIIREFGDPSVFVSVEMEKPKLRAGHVLVRVEATSINPIDLKIRSGVVKMGPELPAILQGDVAGTVEDVGEGVKNFQIGDEVYGCAGGFKGTGGALAEYMLADVNLLAHKPKEISMKAAASLPLVTITAWEALIERARIQSGQKVLIHAGTGGVGHVAVQLAKAFGATVYTTVSSEEKAEIAYSLGADVVINYKKTNVADYVDKYTNGHGFDVVFDTVGGENLDRSFQAASLNGTVVSIATRSTHDLSPLHAKGLSLHVVFMLLPIVTNRGRERHGEILAKVNELITAGKLNPLLAEKDFIIDQVADAHRYLESGSAVGKVVLTRKLIMTEVNDV
jgi:NADPH:quinone reductase